MPKTQNLRTILLLLYVAIVLMAMVALPIRALALSMGGIAELTNQQRTAAGLSSLSYSAQLTSAANAKAAHMCVNNYWAHTAPDGTTGWYFISQSGYVYAAAGENLAKGFSSDSDLVAAWMASSSHRANIVNSSYKDIGIGMYMCGSDVEDTIVVAMYGVSKYVPAPVVSAPVQNVTNTTPVAAKQVQDIYPQNTPIKTVEEQAVLPVTPVVHDVESVNLAETLLERLYDVVTAELGEAPHVHFISILGTY